MKQYVYFISGIYRDGTRIKFWNAEAKRDKEITTFHDITSTTEGIRQIMELGHDPIALNFVLLRIEEE